MFQLKAKTRRMQLCKTGFIGLHKDLIQRFPEKICMIQTDSNGLIALPIQFIDYLAKDQVGMNMLSNVNIMGQGVPDNSQLILTPAVKRSFKNIGKCKIFIGFEKPMKTKTEINKPMLISLIKSQHSIINSGIYSTVLYEDILIEIRPEISKPESNCGLLAPQTIIQLCKQPSQVKMQLVDDGEVNEDDQLDAIPVKFDISNCKVGGLMTQLKKIYRRIFATRELHPKVLRKLGMKHLKGILLHGPPGTGKTLIAREISKMMDVQPKIVNGPEILSEYVGKAEEAVRNLFADAIQEQQQKGMQSRMHCIVIDEIDSLCGKRTSGNQKVFSLIVNQFLACIDGVKQINNILVIGMTNRKDLLDQAILRPGRLQVHIQVSLPDQEGREEILKIHTQSIRKHRILAEGVSLSKVAAQTSNYTGAELQALIKNSQSFAIDRWKSLQPNFQTQIGKKHFIEQQDIDFALQEIKPQFGMDTKTLDIHMPKTKIRIEKYQNQLIELSNSINRISEGKQTILLTGEPGVGKTLLAVECAKSANFAFTKFVSPTLFLGLSESQKRKELVEIFEDADKCQESFIIIDDFFRIIDYIPFGNQYDSGTLNVLMNLIKGVARPDKKQIIIVTASERKQIREFQLNKLFTQKVFMQQLTAKEIGQVLNQLSVSRKSAIAVLSQTKHCAVSKLIHTTKISGARNAEEWIQNWKNLNRQSLGDDDSTIANPEISD